MDGKAHYSLNWALGVVSTLAEKYARATALVYALYAIDARALAAFLARNDPVYPFLRKRIKYWENDLLYRQLKYLTSDTLFFVEKSAVDRFSAPERLKDRLTAVEKNPNLMELVLKGVREDLANRDLKARSDLTNLLSPPSLQFWFDFGG